MHKAFIAVLFVGAVGACVRIPPARVLPLTIHSLYIPTFQNQSYEPGVEEKLTRLTQEEFLADGRLDIVSSTNADAVLVGKIERFEVTPNRFGRDEFPLSSRITAIADVSLYDPADRRKEKPLMTWNNIDVEYSFVSDARRVIEVIPDDAHEEILRSLARQIVASVVTRRPTDRADLKGTRGAARAAPPQKVLGREKVDTRFQDIRTSESQPLEEPETQKTQTEENP